MSISISISIGIGIGIGVGVGVGVDVLNVTCVTQGATLATRAGIYMPTWMAIKARYLQ